VQDKANVTIKIRPLADIVHFKYALQPKYTLCLKKPVSYYVLK